MTYINPNAFEIKALITKDNYREFDNFKPWTIINNHAYKRFSLYLCMVLVLVIIFYQVYF